jgi:hypothetical protein
MKHATADLWFIARQMLTQLLCVAGAATAAALAGLTRRHRAEVLTWLPPLETLVRKLLLIEAAALAPRLIAKRAGGDQRARTARAHQVAFKLSPLALPKAHPARIRLLGAPTTLAELWLNQRRAARVSRLSEAPRAAPNVRLANRIAALAAVIAKPLPHARRLARLLRRPSGAAKLADAIASARLGRRPLTFNDQAFASASGQAAHIAARAPEPG